MTLPSQCKEGKNHICIECGNKWSCVRFRTMGNCPAYNLICGKCFCKNEDNHYPTHGQWFQMLSEIVS